MIRKCLHYLSLYFTKHRHKCAFVVKMFKNQIILCSDQAIITNKNHNFPPLLLQLKPNAKTKTKVPKPMLIEIFCKCLEWWKLYRTNIIAVWYFAMTLTKKKKVFKTWLIILIITFFSFFFRPLYRNIYFSDLYIEICATTLGKFIARNWFFNK